MDTISVTRENTKNTIATAAMAAAKVILCLELIPSCSFAAVVKGINISEFG